MRGYSEIIRNIIEQIPYNEIFVASELKKKVISEIPDAIYYKTLERMVKQCKLVHLAKGIYYKPYFEQENIEKIEENVIIDYYVRDNNGIVIGEDFLIESGIVKNQKVVTKILTNKLVEEKKKIKDIKLIKTELVLDDETIPIIETLEALQICDTKTNYDKKRFVAYMKKVAEKYSDNAAEYVLTNAKYKKSTIAYYKRLLDWYGVNNSMDKYLSSLSEYKIPSIEELKLEIPIEVQTRLSEYVEGVQKIYDRYLEQIILYGSYARGNYVQDSDIDIMILVDLSEIEIKTYRHTLSDLTYDFNMDYDLDIKPITKNISDFQKWVEVYPFYANIKKEGVELYGVA